MVSYGLLRLCVFIGALWGFAVVRALNTSHDAASAHVLPAPAIRLHLNRTAGYLLDSRRARRLQASVTEAGGGRGIMDPLYRGFGTHYAFVWVGTPPQRVSVIVDTGSHWTAFPCSGCQCGRHMDSYFDTSKSSTATVPSCGAKAKCYFSQSYSEGSSWRAFKVTDKFWVGGSIPGMVMDAKDLAMDFTFGCQERETGLFRTQMVDGIMGLSASADTLPFKLFEKKMAKSKAFSMCYRVGGGILNLGGLDASLNSGPMAFAKLLKTSGWFTVKVLKVSMRSSDGKSEILLNDKPSVLGSGSGCIVDSGTTDTYLPASMRNAFVSAFSKLTKGNLAYSNKQVTLTNEQVGALPTLVFKMEGRYGEPINVEMPPESYTETAPGGGGTRRNFRVYVTEPRGMVLGANFMNDQNVVFDIQNQRVGFAKSDCHFRNHYQLGEDVKVAARKMDDEVNAIFIGKKQDTKRTNANTRAGINKVGVLPSIPVTAMGSGKGGHRVVPKGAMKPEEEPLHVITGESSSTTSVNPGDYHKFEAPECEPDPEAHPLSACIASCRVDSSTEVSEDGRGNINSNGRHGHASTDQMADGKKRWGMFKNFNEKLKQQQHQSSPHQASGAKTQLASGYITQGYQLWTDSCWRPREGVDGVPAVRLGLVGVGDVAEGVVSKPCYLHCSRQGEIVAQSPQSNAISLYSVMQLPPHRRVDGNCFSGIWTPCSSSCVQKRRAGEIYNTTESAKRSIGSQVYNSFEQIKSLTTFHAPTGVGMCRWEMQERRCTSNLCPMSAGDHKLIMEMEMMGITPDAWSTQHGADIEQALGSLLDVPPSAVHVSSMVHGVRASLQQPKMETKIRLKAQVSFKIKDYRKVSMSTGLTTVLLVRYGEVKKTASSAGVMGDIGVEKVAVSGSEELPSVFEMGLMLDRLADYLRRGTSFPGDFANRINSGSTHTSMDWTWFSQPYLSVKGVTVQVQRQSVQAQSKQSYSVATTKQKGKKEDTPTRFGSHFETVRIPAVGAGGSVSPLVHPSDGDNLFMTNARWWIYTAFVVGMMGCCCYGAVLLCSPQLLPTITWGRPLHHMRSQEDHFFNRDLSPSVSPFDSVDKAVEYVAQQSQRSNRSGSPKSSHRSPHRKHPSRKREGTSRTANRLQVYPQQDQHQHQQQL